MKKLYKMAIIVLIFTSVILSLFTIIIIKEKYFSKKVYAAIEEHKLNANKESKYNILQIIQENTKETITEEILAEKKDVEFTTKYIKTDKIAKGTLQVIQDGMDGEEQVTTKKTYINGELANEEICDTKLLKSSMEKIVQIGTGPESLKYTINVNDKMYVTSSILAIYLEKDTSSKKIITISKSAEVKILEIDGDWVKVKYETYTGWTKKDCLTKATPNSPAVTKTETTTQIEKFNKDMELNKKSGLSLEQFKKALTNNSQDKKNVFNDNYEYFYYAEQQYNINGLFLASVAIHESNWGTSNMAQNKKNLFGYGAYDRNPSDNAYVFNTYSEGIDLLARVFTKYYLNPKGTAIYNNERASGSHYNGATVSGVNKHYATDKNWANAVCKWMEYLYNKI